ncbi:MAG TPA: hypothetical protein VF840_08405 [Terriglobales bacterium]
MVRALRTSQALIDHIAASGFPYVGDLVHVFIGGSELHGAKVHGTDNLDIYGVFIEPPHIALGLNTLQQSAGDGPAAISGVQIGRTGLGIADDC